MFLIFLVLYYVSNTDGYNIEGGGAINLNKDDILQFANDIMSKQDDVSLSDAIQRRTRQSSILDIFKGIEVNVQSLLTPNEANLREIDDSTNNNVSPDESFMVETSPHEAHFLAEEFIKILIRFDAKPLEQAWDTRPSLESYTADDLIGTPNNKIMFLEHLQDTKDLYRMTIDKCEAQQFLRYQRTMPDHLIVTDLVNMADSYNIELKSNRDIPFKIYRNGRISNTSFTADDLVGKTEDKIRFLKRFSDFNSIAFVEAFSNISHHMYGLDVPEHVKSEWVVATAKNYNIEIISNSGQKFDMNWHDGPRSYIGYPPGSPGGMEYVNSICLKTKINQNNAKRLQKYSNTF